MPKSFYGLLLKFKNRRHGNFTIITALLLPVLIGFAALSIDYGVWTYQKRKLQMVADSAAIGGLYAITSGNPSQVTAYATADALFNGFTAGSGKTITVNNPPVSGANAGKSSAVQVILTQQASLYLAGLFLSTPPTITATAVSANSGGSACVVTLGSSGGITLNGNGSITSPGCGIYVNATGSSSIKTNGNGSLSALSVFTVGGISGGGVTGTNGVSTYTSPVSDPYAGLTMPSAGSCNYTNFSSNSTTTLSPGTYCGGMDIKSRANVTLNPGTYILTGDLKVNGNATLQGAGVTIVMTGSSGSYGSVSVNGGATLNLSAPTSGSLSSILFFGDRNASNVTHDFSGGATATLNGIIYAPASSLKFGGNSSGSGGGGCSQIITSSLTVSGASGFGSGCTTSQVTAIGSAGLTE